MECKSEKKMKFGAFELNLERFFVLFFARNGNGIIYKITFGGKIVLTCVLLIFGVHHAKTHET